MHPFMWMARRSSPYSWTSQVSLMCLHSCAHMESQHARLRGMFTGSHVLQLIHVLQQASSRTALQGCARNL